MCVGGWIGQRSQCGDGREKIFLFPCYLGRSLAAFSLFQDKKKKKKQRENLVNIMPASEHLLLNTNSLKPSSKAWLKMKRLWTEQGRCEEQVTVPETLCIRHRPSLIVAQTRKDKGRTPSASLPPSHTHLKISGDYKLIRVNNESFWDN